MPSFQTRTVSIGGDSDQVVELRKSFRESSRGWICNTCGALAPEPRDAEKHLAWHETLGK
jgi:hypothetical protein